MNVKETNKIKLMSATYLNDYVIRFVFSDGKVHDLDFFPFLSKVPQNPMTSKYLDLKKFKKFEILGNRDISWNDYEMCYDFFTLYYGFEDGPRYEKLYDEKVSPIKVVCFPVEKRKKIVLPKVKRKKEFA